MQGAWYGVIFIILVIIAVIITIIVLNRGNILNVVENLPDYKILYPAGNVYLGLLNVRNNPNVPTAPGYYITGTPVWQPVVYTSANPDLNLWSLVKPTSSSFSPQLLPDEQLFQLRNSIYNVVGVQYIPPSSPTGPAPLPIPSQIGFVGSSPGGIVINNLARIRLIPTYSPANAPIFIYKSLPNNQFTLRSSTTTEFVSVDANNQIIYTSGSNVQPAVFQLVPLSAS